ncbi:MAG: hypothetical protein IPL78_20985 [Chloroflexi bacterium]|nr:hypothetical protein [Chloroflexota bacterium]
MNPIQERVAEDMAKATNTHNPDAISLYMVTRMLLDDVTGLTRSSNYEEALTLADRGMKKLEQYMEEHPSEKSIFEFTLFQLYGMKANCFVQLGQTDVAYKKLALKQIEMAFNATSNVPQIMHTVMMRLQADLKRSCRQRKNVSSLRRLTGVHLRRMLKFCVRSVTLD